MLWFVEEWSKVFTWFNEITEPKQGGEIWASTWEEGSTELDAAGASDAGGLYRNELGQLSINQNIKQCFFWRLTYLS